MQDALLQESPALHSPAQQSAPTVAATRPTPLPLRHDTILGVCQGLGEDFGFNPMILRLAFATSFYFSPTWVVGAYLALGLAVALARLLAPARAVASAPQLASVDEAPAGAENEDSRTVSLAA